MIKKIKIGSLYSEKITFNFANKNDARHLLDMQKNKKMDLEPYKVLQYDNL